MFLCITFPGLRHVRDDQKTYKNPSLRAQGGQTPSPTKSHAPGPKSPQSPPQKHAPVFELEGKKWRVVSEALVPLFLTWSHGRTNG